MRKAELNEKGIAICPECKIELNWYQDHRNVEVKGIKYCQFIRKCTSCNELFQYLLTYGMDNMYRVVIDEEEIEIVKEIKVNEKDYE